MNKETEKIIKEIDNTYKASYVEMENINNKNIYPTKPYGKFVCMLEIFSDGVSPYDDESYRGWFSEEDLSGTYIRDAMIDIIKTQRIAKEIKEKYGDKVEVVFLDFNQGCQYGCAINIWVRKQ